MKDFETNLTQARLKEVLSYSLETGLFSWLVNRGKARINSIAGKRSDKGYILISIDGFTYRAHRLAWFYVKGKWPSDQIDHKNTVKCDNRWENLRGADNQLNQINTSVSKNNKLGFKGVYPHVNSRTNTLRYRAKINIKEKQIHLGTFDTPELASEAYQKAASLYFGEYARS